MVLEGKSENGSVVAVRVEAISAVRKKGNACWVCAAGAWVHVDRDYDELVKLIWGEP